jgi:hypothetical protein
MAVSGQKILKNAAPAIAPSICEPQYAPHFGTSILASPIRSRAVVMAGLRCPPLQRFVAYISTARALQAVEKQTISSQLHLLHYHDTDRCCATKTESVSKSVALFENNRTSRIWHENFTKPVRFRAYILASLTIHFLELRY